MHLRSAAFAALLIPTLARAQQVLVVSPTAGPGVFSTSLATAVNSAQNGDVVLVKAGSYSESFPIPILGKSLVITAEAGATVALNGQLLISGLSASQRVVVRGIDVTAHAQFNALVLLNDSGPVWAERCTFKGGYQASAPTVAGMGGRVVGCAAAVFTRCALLGGDDFSTNSDSGGIGLSSLDSNLYLSDTQCIGMDGEDGTSQFWSGNGGAGASVTGGSLFATGSLFQGGKGGSNSTPLPVGAGNGGAGLALTASGVAVDCVFVGGRGGTSSVGPGVNGAGVSGATLTVLPGAARHFAVDSPVREGQSTTMHLGGLPNESVGVIYGPVPSSLVALPAFGGALLIDAATSSGLILGNLSPTGSLSVPVAMPMLPASVLAVPLHLQAVFFDAPLTYAALGPPSSLLLLDSTL